MRYAIYFAPERDTRLWSFGNHVLGRDAETGEDVPQILPDGFSADDWHTYTESPRRYGFHATLKAPFALKEGRTEEELFAAVRDFAVRRPPISGLHARPVLDGSYVMIEQPAPDPRLQDFAAACVTEFDPFRAALSQADIARRLSAPLTPRQKQYLDRWGYPYVLDDFTFHLSLAGPLPAERAGHVLTALQAAHAADVQGEELTIRSVCVFAEPGRGEPCVLVLRVPLAGATT